MESDLSRFGDRVLSKDTLTLLANAEKHPPTLQKWDTFGRRRDELLTSEGWRGLQKIGIKEGIVAIPYVSSYGAYNRVYQFIKSVSATNFPFVISEAHTSEGIIFGVPAPHMLYAHLL